MVWILAHQGADDGVPRALQLVVVVRQELAMAHLQVHHLIPQLWHINTWHAPAHLHMEAKHTVYVIWPMACNLTRHLPGRIKLLIGSVVLKLGRSLHGHPSKSCISPQRVCLQFCMTC